MNSNAKWFAIGAVTCAGCFVLGGTGNQPDDPTERVLKARVLKIVDENGHDRILLMSHEGRTVIGFSDVNQHTRASIIVEDDGGSHVTLRDPAGIARTEIAAFTEMAMMKLGPSSIDQGRGHLDAPVTISHHDRLGPNVSLASESGELAAGVSAGEGGGFRALYFSADRKPRFSMYTRKDPSGKHDEFRLAISDETQERAVLNVGVFGQSLDWFNRAPLAPSEPESP